MAAPPSFSLIILSLITILLASLFLIPGAHAQLSASTKQINIFTILQKAGQYSTLIHLLNQTQVGNQINNQSNNTNDGLTVFAPTDNAFNKLRAGTLNKLTDQQLVQLVLYHILPKCYSLKSLQTVSNPVRTQLTGQGGGVFGLNFTVQGNQLYVSTGIVKVPISKALRESLPLAIYKVDKVLLPKELNL